MDQSRTFREIDNDGRVTPGDSFDEVGESPTPATRVDRKSVGKNDENVAFSRVVGPRSRTLHGEHTNAFLGCSVRGPNYITRMYTVCCKIPTRFRPTESGGCYNSL